MFFGGFSELKGMTQERTDLKLKEIVNFDDNSYLVSTCWTPDKGYETMVFESRYQPETKNEETINYDLIDFSGIHESHYETIEEMEKGHRLICANLKKILCK